MSYKVYSGTEFEEGHNPLFAYVRQEEIVAVEDGTTSIYHGAFANCKTIKKVILPESVTSIGDNAFKNCTEIEEIFIPDSVTYIGKSAFQGCESLKKIRMSEEIEYVELGWFMLCINLENIYIGPNVKQIKSSPFFDFWKNFKGFTINEKNEDFVLIDGNLFGKKRNELIKYVQNQKNETEYEIPSFVTTIRKDAFKRCDKLKKLILSKNLKHGVEYTAFAKNIETIDINGNKNFVFKDGILYDKRCEKVLRVLSNVKRYKTLETVKKICAYAFFDGKIEEIELTDNVTTIEEDAIRSCENLTKIVIPASVKKIANRSLLFCDNVTICCYRGTPAEAFAKERNINMEYLK